MSVRVTADQIEFLIGLIGDGESVGENLRAIREALIELRDRRAVDLYESEREELTRLRSIEVLLAGHEMVVPVQWEERSGQSVLRATSEPFDIAWASDDPKACMREDIERAYGVIHFTGHSGSSGRLESNK